MTTRNQKKKQSANQKPSSSAIDGVDFYKEPIVALPASNPQSDLPEKNAAATNLAGNYVDKPTNSKPSSSSPLKTQEPATPAAATAKPLRNTTSNPVVRDIVDLKSGELKVVSPAVSKYFGFPAGPVSKLNFSDPKVVEFFKDSEAAATMGVLGTVDALSGPVLDSRTEIAAAMPISSLGNTQNSIRTVPPTPVAMSSPNSASEAAGSMKGVDGSTARPSKAAGNPQHPSHNAAPASWAGLFKNNRVLSEDTKLNPNFDGVSTEKVILCEEDLDDDDEEKRSLIGFFNGKFPGIKAIQHIVDDWSRKCSFHLHNSGWLVFTFENALDCDTVMKEGPYYAFHKPLVLKKMPVFFDFSDEAYSTAPVWIQLPNLPLRAWNKKALEKICSFLGTPLHVDQVTNTKTEKSFARCLVEMDVSKELPNLVCCDLPGGKFLRQHVLYEDTPTFCSNCKKLGHETEDCYASNKGAPSLYVVKNKKDKKKQGTVGTDLGAGNLQGKNRAAGHPGHAKQGAAKGNSGTAAAPLTSANAAASKVTNDKALGHVSKPNDAAGTSGSGMDSRQPIHPQMASALNNKKGITVGTNAKDSGLVSANTFGPLANGNGEMEASATDNTKNKNNGKKKG